MEGDVVDSIPNGGDLVSINGRRLVVVGGERVEIETFDAPEPGPGQVLVRVNRSQVSAGSEMGALIGAKPPDSRRYLGYTTVGSVLSVGPGRDDLAPGDRVLSFGNHGSHWLSGSVPNEKAIQRFEYDITDEQAAFSRLGDVALHGVRRGQLQLDESVAIFGQGVVGQLVTAFCRISGAYPVIAIDLEDDRLKLSKQSGATHTINASNQDPIDLVRTLTDGGAQTVFHVNRDPGVLVDCMKSAADRGKVILTGSPPGKVEIGLQVELLRRELDIRGTYGRGLDESAHPYWPWTLRRDRETIMRMISTGDLQVDHLISHVARPEEANELYHKMVSGPTGWMSVFFDWTGS